MFNRNYNDPQKKRTIGYIPMKDNNDISTSITKNWTDQAIRCYVNECNCTNCSISSGNYSFMCQMSSVVKILLEQIGPPEANKIEKLSA